MPDLSRTVVVKLSEEFVRDTPGPISKTVSEAVGYLANWSIGGRFGFVRVFGSAGGYLEAHYYDRDGGDVGFVIGAVRDVNGDYSFHS